MAITRAQQAKQMLQNGGRIGLRFGNRGPGEASRESRDNRDRGMGMGGKQRSAPARDTGGRDPMAQFSGGANTEGVTFMDQARRDVNPLGILTELPGTVGMVSRALTPNPFGFSRARRPVTTPVSGGGDSQAMASAFIPAYIRAGFNTQEEYDEFLASQGEDEAVDDKIERSLAFRADGGRIGAQEGGIMPRLNQLGSGVSSAEQMLQGINQRLESAESSLGGGGAMQQPASLTEIANNLDTFPGNPNRPTSPFMGGIPAPEPQRFSSYEEMMSKRITSDVPGFFTDLEGVQRRPDGSLFEPKFGELPVALPQAPVATRTGSLGNQGQGDPLFEPKMSGIPAAGYADGGNVVGGEYDFESARQMYGLGKLVKKVTRTVKKIAKSPIGKAALLYAGTGGLGNLAAGKGFFGGAMSNIFKPTTFLGNVPKIFSGEGIRNILVGRPGFYENLANKPGEGIFTKATRGIFGTGGEFNPFTTTAAFSLLGALTPEEELQAQELADSSTDFDLEKARNSILAAKREQYMMDVRARGFKADGGRIEYQEGSKEPVAKKTMPLLDMGGKEMDLREEGGFVPIGRMEKADDVPARLSKNEFVFTADAVRNAGDGDVDKGAEVMYNMMKNLESGGIARIRRRT